MTFRFYAVQLMTLIGLWYEVVNGRMRSENEKNFGLMTDKIKSENTNEKRIRYVSITRFEVFDRSKFITKCLRCAEIVLYWCKKGRKIRTEIII